MKNLTTAIFGKLAGSTLDADISGRLFKGRAPDEAEFPYAVYDLISAVPERTFTEHYENVIMQFDLFSSASGSTEIEDMYTHLNALYDECAMTITGSTLVWMRRTNAILTVEEFTTAAGTQEVWHYAVDFEVLTSLS